MGSTGERGRWGIMAAVSPEGSIGLGGKIPWRYPGDMRRVKRLTTGKTIIMGRATWESLGRKPLPGRRNLVVAREDQQGVETFRSLSEALRAAQGDVWFFGGARIYEEAMAFADFIDLVYVPDHVEAAEAVRFPPIDPEIWDEGPLVVHEEEPLLRRRVYTRRAGR